MNDTIEKALLTWYPKDHKLHLDLLHPAMKLAGEAGEIVDLVAKHKFKPGFSMWSCKYCNKSKTLHDDNKCHSISRIVHNRFYTPLIADELGDWWYYCRILAYITDKELAINELQANEHGLLIHINGLNVMSALIFSEYLDCGSINTSKLQIAFSWFITLLQVLDLSLDQITESNYRKLNSDPTHHGWKGA